MIIMKQHRYSAEFPSMSAEHFALFKADIEKNGQVEFITAFEGKILDGWHRYQACTELGLTPKLKEFRGKDAISFVESVNIHRRHLQDESQRAMIAVGLNKWRPRGGQTNPPVGGITEKTAEELAAKADVGTRTIERAKVVHEEGSKELKEAVKEGEITLRKAVEIAELPKVEQKAAIKEAKEPKAKKPKPEKKPKAAKKVAAPKVATVTKEKHDALIAKYDELLEEHKDMATEVENLSTVKDGDSAKQMKKLQALLDQANRSRDEAVNKAAALQKQNKYLEAELKKLGWKRAKP